MELRCAKNALLHENPKTPGSTHEMTTEQMQKILDLERELRRAKGDEQLIRNGSMLRTEEPQAVLAQLTEDQYNQVHAWALKNATAKVAELEKQFSEA